MKKTKVYYGDNGVQEFWESRDHEVLIVRVKHEKWWQVIFDGASLLDEALPNLTEALKWANAKQENTKQWKKVNQYAMKLKTVRV